MWDKRTPLQKADVFIWTGEDALRIWDRRRGQEQEIPFDHGQKVPYVPRFHLLWEDPKHYQEALRRALGRGKKRILLAVPDDAFYPEEEGVVTYRNYSNYIWRLRPAFQEFGILVASNNNGAVENITHGLPGRDALNCAFLSACLAAGLNVPIVNTGSPAVQDALDGARVLMGEDPGCAAYIARHSGTRAAAPAPEDPEKLLQSLVASGRKGEVPAAVQELLGRLPPMEIVTGLILPALTGYGRNHHSCADLSVLGQQSLAGGDQYFMINLQIFSEHLRYLSVILLRRSAGLTKIVDFICITHTAGNNFHRMDVSKQALSQYDVRNAGSARHGISHPGGTIQHCFSGKRRSRPGHASCSLENTDPHTGDHRISNLVHLLRHNADIFALGMLCKNLRVISSCRQGLSQSLL